MSKETVVKYAKVGGFARKLVPAKLRRAVATGAGKVRKQSPNILMVAGVGGIVGGVIMACKRTMTVNEITQPRLDEIKKLRERKEKDPESFAPKEYEQNIVAQHVALGIEVAKHYAVPALMIGLGIASIVGSNYILKNRLSAALVAYETIDKAFSEYRDRVREKLGEEEEYALRHDLDMKIDKVDEVDRTVYQSRGGANLSGYAKWFDESSTKYHNDPTLNRAFLVGVQQYYNEMLNIKGYVFLNDVYDALGLPKTRAGQIVGWMSEARGGADGYIDFGLYDHSNEANVMFVNGVEKQALLDFNVDGPILNRL